MAGISYQSWGWNRGHDPEWNIADVAVTTTQFEWLVTCFVPSTSYAYEINVNGVMKHCGPVFLVGLPPAITPPTPVTSVSAVITSGDMQAGASQPYTNIYSRGDYIYLQQPDGNSGIYSEADYTFETMQDFYDAMDNGEILPITPDVYFDVYVNGSDKPSLFVNWTAGEDLSPVMLTPKVWIGCESLITLIPDITTQEGINAPNPAAWNVDSAGAQSYGGSYSITFLAIQQHFEQYLNAVSKLERWGFNGDPEYVRLYLRMDYGDQIGELYRVGINIDGSTQENYKVPDSSLNATYDTYVRIHAGEPDYVPPEDPEGYPSGTNADDDGPGKYDPDNIPDPDDFTDPVGFDGNAVLTTTYALSDATLQNIGQKLWSQDYFNVLKIQTNPIENIVAVKHFPFAMTGSSQEVKVGDVAFGINGDKVPSVKTLSIGSYTYTGHFKNYLDLSPFTLVKIHLPYIGLFQLDPADILGCKLGVKYYVDLVTGQCMAKLILDEKLNGKSIPYMTVFGQMGVDIPLTSTDRVQAEIRAASASVSAMGSVVGHLMGGDALGAAVSGATGALNIAGADYTSQRTASQSPVCAAFDTQDVYMLIERPASEYVETQSGTPSGYKHLHGQPSNKYRYLRSYPAGSFVQVDRRADLKFAMTSEENAMLEQLLTEGVYI